MPIIDTAADKARLLAAKDEDDVVDHCLSSSTRGVGKLWSALPAIRGRIIDVDEYETSWVPSADCPNAIPDNNDGKMVSHARQLCPELPTFSRGINQHAAGSTPSADDIKPITVRDHAVAPTRLEHGRQDLPAISARG
jgi:hypothetical protein